MTNQNAAVYPSHPPEPIMRLMNSLLPRLLRTPLAGGARKQFMVLGFNGRKSGRRFTITVSAHLIDEVLYALAGSVWTVNFRGGGPADILYDGKTKPDRRAHRGPRGGGRIVPPLRDGVRVSRAQRMMGVKFRDPRVPTLEEFRAAVVENNFVAIRFTPA